MLSLSNGNPNCGLFLPGTASIDGVGAPDVAARASHGDSDAKLEERTAVG